MTGLAQRLARFRAQLAASGVPAALISGLANIRYLSGFTGTYGALLVDANRALLISDFRYRYQAAEQAPLFEFAEIQRWVEGVAQVIRKLGCRAVGFEPAHTTCQVHGELAAQLDGVDLVPLGGVVEKMRAIKDAEELALIERAAAISSAAVERVISLIRPGVSERELALAAHDYIMREAGAQLAFDPIVASGPRAAQCHAEPGERRVALGDMVVIDVGARWQGYGADITRTVAVGAAQPPQREIYAACWQAQQKALRAVRAGVSCAALDAMARSVIEEAGYGDAFGHGLGHGVGLESHELPRLTRGEETPLDAHMVATVEPGIYIPEVGGVRLEDLVVVTEDGCRLLTHAAKPEQLPVVG